MSPLNDRLQRSIMNAVSRRRIFPYLAGVTLGLALLSGLLVRMADETNFPNYGTAVWWAIVTLATVGYGDVVPTTPLGRLIGGVVILIGVTFLAFLTATVTSAFVSSEQEESQRRERERDEEKQADLVAALTRLEDRMAAIEKKLGDQRAAD